MCPILKHASSSVAPRISMFVSIRRNETSRIQGCQMVYIFAYQKSKFWYIWEGLGMENVVCFGPFGIFYVHLMYFMTLEYILWSFGVFFTFWYVLQRKIWQPWLKPKLSRLKTKCDDSSIHCDL
jgi:hypothetical protein